MGLLEKLFGKRKEKIEKKTTEEKDLSWSGRENLKKRF